MTDLPSLEFFLRAAFVLVVVALACWAVMIAWGFAMGAVDAALESARLEAMRPPEPSPPVPTCVAPREPLVGLERGDLNRLAAAELTLRGLGYTYHGGALWKPPLGPTPPGIGEGWQ